MTHVRLDRYTILHDGVERRFRLYIPAKMVTPTPLLLVLHGGSGTITSVVRVTRAGFHELAEEHGFIVVYPEGLHRFWNDGRPIRGRYSDADDVGFIDAMIEQIASQYPLDRRRIFSTGISNGGHMSYRLACELSDQIAGIAPVAALLPGHLVETCAPVRPVGVLIMAGTDDPLVPYGGGDVQVGRARRGAVLSAQETARFWAAANHCDAEPLTTLLPDADPDDGTRIRHTVYNGGDAPVELYTVEGGGHTWPGGWQYLPARIVGKTSREIDACRVIWDFFASLT